MESRLKELEKKIEKIEKEKTSEMISELETKIKEQSLEIKELRSSLQSNSTHSDSILASVAQLHEYFKGIHQRMAKIEEFLGNLPNGHQVQERNFSFSPNELDEMVKVASFMHERLLKVGILGSSKGQTGCFKASCCGELHDGQLLQ